MKKSITILLVLASVVSFGQAKHKGKYGVYSFEDTVYFKNVPYSASASIVHLGIDTLVTSPTFGKLVRKTANSGISGITADNGLTASTTTNTQLGGTLSQNTGIATGAFTLSVTTGTGATNPLSVSSTTGNAISASSTSGAALSAGATSGLAIAATNSGTITAQFLNTGGGVGTYATSSGISGRFETNPASTNTVVTVLDVYRKTTNTAADGIGGSIDLGVEADNGSVLAAGQIIAKFTTAANATPTSQLALTGRNNGATDTLAAFGGRVNLTESSATKFTSTTIATGKIQGGSILVTIEANDATDFQSRTLRFIWSAVNKAGTITITLSTPEEVVALSSGTLTCTITGVDAGSGVLDFKANAVSSLTQSTLRATYQTFKNF